MPTIVEIYNRRDEWIKMALKLGADKSLADDMVQDMFVKLLEIDKREKGLARIEYNGDINTMYLWTILRSIFTDHIRKEKEFYQHDPIEYDNADKEFENLCDCMDETLRNSHWFDKRIFDLYFDDELNFSMRDLERETKISLSTIFETIKNAKKKIKTKCRKQWNKYQEAKYS